MESAVSSAGGRKQGTIHLSRKAAAFSTQSLVHAQSQNRLSKANLLKEMEESPPQNLLWLIKSVKEIIFRQVLV